MDNKALIDIFIIDENDDFRCMLENLFRIKNISYKSFKDGQDAIDVLPNYEIGCIISDVKASIMNGVTFTKKIKNLDENLPVIIITNYVNVKMAVIAMQNGATEFLKKPFNNDELYALVLSSLAVAQASREQKIRNIKIQKNISLLTIREKYILKLLALGLSSKEIGLKLDISYRTVEVHRSHITKKLSAKSVVDFVMASNYV